MITHSQPANVPPTSVVVIGGGYAGVIAANHLRLNADVAVTLINPRPEFVERIRLHQAITGSDDAMVDYARRPRRRRPPGDRHRRDHRRGDAHRHARPRVTPSATTTSSTRSAAPAPTLTVPGAAEFAYPISEWEHAEPLHAALTEVHPGAPVVVVGAGPTGIEVAAELAEQGRAVTLVCGDVLGPYFSESTRRSVTKRMRKLGVTIVAGRAPRSPRCASIRWCWPTVASCQVR